MDVKKMLLEYDYIISNSDEYKDNKIIKIKDSTEFLKWFMGDKSLFSKNIGFIIDNEGEIIKVEILYDFLKY